MLRLNARALPVTDMDWEILILIASAGLDEPTTTPRQAVPDSFLAQRASATDQRQQRLAVVLFARSSR